MSNSNEILSRLRQIDSTNQSVIRPSNFIIDHSTPQQETSENTKPGLLKKIGQKAMGPVVAGATLASTFFGGGHASTEVHAENIAPQGIHETIKDVNKLNSVEAQPQTVTVTYEPGWNLVSAPAGTKIPADTPLYSLGAGNGDPSTTASYSADNEQITQESIGYWAFFSKETTVTLTAPATVKPTYTLPQPSGSSENPLWVTVGNPTASLVKFDQQFYGYDPTTGYALTDTLKPGQGGLYLVPPDVNGSHIITIDVVTTDANPTPNVSITTPENTSGNWWEIGPNGEHYTSPIDRLDKTHVLDIPEGKDGDVFGVSNNILNDQLNGLAAGRYQDVSVVDASSTPNIKTIYYTAAKDPTSGSNELSYVIALVPRNPNLPLNFRPPFSTALGGGGGARIINPVPAGGSGFTDDPCAGISFTASFGGSMDKLGIGPDGSQIITEIITNQNISSPLPNSTNHSFTAAQGNEIYATLNSGTYHYKNNPDLPSLPNPPLTVSATIYKYDSNLRVKQYLNGPKPDYMGWMTTPDGKKFEIPPSAVK